MLTLKGFISMCFAISLTLYIGSAQAEWSTSDTARELVYTGILVLDAGTTADIRNDSDMQEMNPAARLFLGANPKPTETAVYFGAIALLHYAVSASLPPKWRRVWQYTTIGVNGAVVASNYSIGLRYGF